MYAPLMLIRSANTRKRCRLGSYEATFLDRIVTRGTIEYEFMIVVHQQDAPGPVLVVTSERNSLSELGLGEGLSGSRRASHFLCVFDERGHHNFGGSDDWADASKFELAALRILAERLQVPPVPC